MPLPRFAKLDPVKQASILEAALEEFADKGFNAASFNRIVERAGVSKGAIYYYFSDKEDLYLTLLERAFSDMARISLPHEAKSVSSYWAGVERLYRDVVQLARRDARVVQLLQGSVADLSRLTQTPRMKPLIETVRKQTERLIHDGQRVGAVRTDEGEEFLVAMSLAIGEALDRHMIASGELKTDKGAERAVERGVDMLRRALAPAKPSAKRRTRGVSSRRSS